MVKAAFFDIDGTLVSFETHTMPESAAEAITALRGKGVKTFIATGRSELMIDNVDISLFDGVISLNGQLAREGARVIHKSPLAGEDVEKIIDYSMRNGVTATFECEDALIMNEPNEQALFVSRQTNVKFPPAADIRRAAGREVIQVTFFGTPEQERELLEIIPGCESTRWSPMLADIMVRGGGKHVGIRKVLEHYGFERQEAIAFGDGENDLTMLRYAGTGVAMGNSAEQVKAVADHITSSVDNDGIANALRHYGMI